MTINKNYVRRYLIALSVTAGPLLVPQSVIAQQAVCDAEIEQRAGGERPYRDRGHACEGTYDQAVKSGIYLYSIYQFFEDFDLSETRAPLIVEWSAPRDSQIALRVDGRVAGEFYRLDTRPPSNSDSFEWGTGILRALSAGSLRPLRRDDLAVRGWFEGEGGADTLFIPLSIRHQETHSACGLIKLVLFPTDRPDSVYVEVTGPDPDDPTRTGSFGERELGRRRYPLNAPLAFDLPEIQRGGIYSVRVAAKLGRERWSPKPYALRVPSDFEPACLNGTGIEE